MGRPVFLLENYNRLWASLWVNTAIAYQVRDFLIAPGMRNLPLIAAVHAHPLAKITTGMDERSLAFFGLGLIKAQRRPVVLIATSGTAGAHFLPAIQEAFLQDLPLLVVTADRPLEMAQTNGHQSLPSHDFFSPFIVGKLALEAPHGEMPLDSLQSLFKKFFAQCLGLMGGKNSGPGHLNFPFRGPLDRTGQMISILRQQELKVYSSYQHLQTNFAVLKELHLPEALRQLHWQRTLLVIGELDYRVNIPNFAKGLAKWPFPFLADITSSMSSNHPMAVPSCDYLRVIALFDKVEVVIHLGGKVTSKFYYQEIRQRKMAFHLITNNQHWTDPAFTLTSVTYGDLDLWWEKFSFPFADTHTDLDFPQLKTKALPIVEGITLLAQEILQTIPPNSTLFLGNSSIIRIFDLVATLVPQRLVRIFTQRGVSGIDGNIAHSLALAQNSNLPVTAVLGDWAMIHDLNALSILAQVRFASGYVLIIFNNGGGKIFELLRPNEDAEVMRLLAQNHHYQFHFLASMFQVPYQLVSSVEDFTIAYRRNLEMKGASIIEVQLSEEMMSSWPQLKKW